MNIQFKLTILSTIRFILSIIFVNFIYFYKSVFIFQFSCSRCGQYSRSIYYSEIQTTQQGTRLFIKYSFNIDTHQQLETKQNSLFSQLLQSQCTSRVDIERLRNLKNSCFRGFSIIHILKHFISTVVIAILMRISAI